jgi:hypothetical protein
MTVADDLKAALQETISGELSPFTLLKSIAIALATPSNRSAAQDIVLRSLEHRDRFGSSLEVLDALVREVGLFPYLDPKTLGLSDRVAYEFHRVPELDTTTVLHREQENVLELLRQGHNVVLSAPTSFGKSLLIDAVIAVLKPMKTVIVVPTVALIEETRRRLHRKFGESRRIVTQNGQASDAETIFILTQERVVERSDLSDVGLFVIDEFYKLNPQDRNDSRTFVLNQAFYMLSKTGAQFYMLGPGIRDLSDAFKERVEHVFVRLEYNTVACDVFRVASVPDELTALATLCAGLHEPTIVYCNSPRRTAEVARAISSIPMRNTRLGDLGPALDWLSSTFHPKWHLVESLREGVGIHHGRLPKPIAHFVVRAFNEGKVDFMVCTSALIEVVNTAAKNVVMFDGKVGISDMDVFTFNNIKGRSGRMFRHYVGHVFVFGSAPSGQLPTVDLPVLSQGPNAPDSLLLQIDDNDLSSQSRSRMKALADNVYLPLEVLRSNSGVDPQVQLRIAQEIADNIAVTGPMLAWSSIPTTTQLRYLANLIWRHFNGANLANRSFYSSDELTRYIVRLSRFPTTRDLIDELIASGAAPDDAVTKTLDRLRTWVALHLPQFIGAVSRIQRYVLGSRGLPWGDFIAFGSLVQSRFFRFPVAGLEELGIPVEILAKLAQHFRGVASIDEAIDVIRRLPLPELGLHAFEIELIEDVRRSV